MNYKFYKPIILIQNKEDFLKACTNHENGFIALSPLYAGTSLGLIWWRYVTEKPPFMTIESYHKIESIFDCSDNGAMAQLELKGAFIDEVCFLENRFVVCSSMQQISKEFQNYVILNYPTNYDKI